MSKFDLQGMLNQGMTMGEIEKEVGRLNNLIYNPSKTSSEVRTLSPINTIQQVPQLTKPGLTQPTKPVPLTQPTAGSLKSPSVSLNPFKPRTAAPPMSAPRPQGTTSSPMLNRGPTTTNVPLKGFNLSKKPSMKKGGAVKSSASKRADGCAVRGKTKGRMV